MIRHSGWDGCEPRPNRVFKGVNIAEFKERAEREALARIMFYEDVDGGKIPHLSREWTLAPMHVQQLYRSLALRVNQARVVPSGRSVKQSRWYHLLFARFMGGQA